MSEEINKQIHEHIFKKCCHEVQNERCTKCGESVYQFMPPNYSGSISEAWQVVDKMQSLGFNDFTVGAYGSQGVGYFAWFYKEGEEFQESGETVPLAICKAALAAVGIEKLEGGDCLVKA